MLQERIDYFTHIFNLLQDTNSRLEKEQIVKDIIPEYKEDFDFILECLAGKHKFGYTYHYVTPSLDATVNTIIKSFTIKLALQFLLSPMQDRDLSQNNVDNHISYTSLWIDFFEPIVNRTLRLGIGNSLITKEKYAPMLAKKLETDVKYSKYGYFVTEKLDGNRCIAWYDGEKWNFTSRNGKPMHVDFDMSQMDKRYVYDGEVMTPAQTNNSYKRTNYLQTDRAWTYEQDSFNVTSGLINQHDTSKHLIYNIFDIIADEPYKDRRHELEKHLYYDNPDIRILPTLGHFDTKEQLFTYLPTMLEKITSTGGEGLMINLADSGYLQKRTDQLLKVKKVYTMDMKVIGVEYGKGKYENQIGALICEAKTEDGYYISCNVGTGLSDAQREAWAIHPGDITNQIVEVSYFSLSQDTSMRGTNRYSLRFPRLKGIRTDKNETSEH